MLLAAPRTPSAGGPIRRHLLLGVVAVAVLGVLALKAFGWREAIAPIQPPARNSFAPQRIEHGAQLAALGNCAVCHTTHDRAPFAGGVPLQTPFGTVYSTNITPDAETGIGRWSEAAFMRAMRTGVARDGHQLYPVFPYEHFARVTDDDLGALYAFLITRIAARSKAPANSLHFPFGFRSLLAGWKLLFLRKGAVPADAGKSAAWNRGAYLVDSLGHCGACHTPRNALGAEKHRLQFEGGEAEGWYAPAINANSPSPLPWTEDQMFDYLRTGLATDHAIAGGPMQTVVAGMGEADPADVRAIATYVVSLMGEWSPERKAQAAVRTKQAGQPLATSAATGGASMADGAAVYASACAGCHDGGRRIASDGALQMPLAIAVYDPDPRSLLRIIREGIAPRDGERGRWMPAFGEALTEAQLTALAAYLRSYAASAFPWPDLERRVKEVSQ